MNKAQFLKIAVDTYNSYVDLTLEEPGFCTLTLATIDAEKCKVGCNTEGYFSSPALDEIMLHIAEHYNEIDGTRPKPAADQ